MRRWSLVSALVLLSAALPAPAALALDYESVVGILEEKCFKCHSERAKVKGNLALDIEEVSNYIGENHPIKPGRGGESDLYLMAAHADTHDPMPPNGKGEALSGSELRKLKEWIDGGALLPGEKAKIEENLKESSLPTEILAWKNSAGQEMKASLVSVRGEEAVFRLADGRTTNYPLSKLSPESRAEALKLAGEEE